MPVKLDYAITNSQNSYELSSQTICRANAAVSNVKLQKRPSGSPTREEQSDGTHVVPVGVVHITGLQILWGLQLSLRRSFNKLSATSFLINTETTGSMACPDH